jgi:tight adherence protein C
MKVILFLLAAALVSLYIASAKKYEDFIKPLDKRRYPLKKFIPIGLYILDISGYKYVTGYDKRLLVKICELSGVKFSQYYLRVHWANKLVYIILSLLLIALIGAVSKPDGGYLFFSLSLIAGVFYFTDSGIDKRIRKRRMSIRLDFPEFINKLALLINAGMTISRAWEKIVTDNKKDGTLYEELCITLSDIRSGKPEQRAYEDFAKRCRSPEITRFVSVILQNLRKGNAEMVSILRVQANECWEMRKNTAKKLGEEASTKMLLPMMLMFLAILLIVGAPAVLAIRGI